MPAPDATRPYSKIPYRPNCSLYSHHRPWKHARTIRAIEYTGQTEYRHTDIEPLRYRSTDHSESRPIRILPHSSVTRHPHTPSFIPIPRFPSTISDSRHRYCLPCFGGFSSHQTSYLPSAIRLRYPSVGILIRRCGHLLIYARQVRRSVDRSRVHLSATHRLQT